MPIIIISRGSLTHGAEIAEALAEKLNFRCFSREILLEASDQFDEPEIMLQRAIENEPSFFDRLSKRKEKYLCYIRAALLKRLQQDNVIYHGYSGHFFVKDVPNVLKVRITASTEARVELIRKRELVSEKEALRILSRVDTARRKWGEYFYGIDPGDPSLFDMVLRIENMTTGDVVELIAKAIQLPCFQLTSASRKRLRDLYAEAQIMAHMAEGFPPIRHVSVDEGEVTLVFEATMKEKQRILPLVEGILHRIEGIQNYRIQLKH